MEPRYPIFDLIITAIAKNIADDVMGSVFVDICPMREQVSTLVSCILGLVFWVMPRWRSLYGARLLSYANDYSIIAT
jgi:hypothetical protein